MNNLLTYFKGLAMGAADVVPGVSGGTIAFITGILDKLLDSVRAINPSLFKLLYKEGVKAAWQKINGTFLVCLLSGILTSIFSLAKLISYLLEFHPIPVWSFFFGLILVSVWHMLRQVQGFGIGRIALFALGALVAWTITVLTPTEIPATYFNVFWGGSLAICAMLLPGISGSFILLLLGLYPAVLAAAKGFQLDILAVFALGALCGILAFSHVLAMLLRRFHDATIFFLTGLMLGTLGKIWPWKQALSWRTNSHGEQVVMTEQNLSPWSYEQITGEPSQLAFAIGCALFGIALVLVIEKISERGGH